MEKRPGPERRHWRRGARRAQMRRHSRLVRAWRQHTRRALLRDHPNHRPDSQAASLTPLSRRRPFWISESGRIHSTAPGAMRTADCSIDRPTQSANHARRHAGRRESVMRARLAGTACFFATFAAAGASEYCADTHVLKLVKEIAWHVHADNNDPKGDAACAVSTAQIANSVQLAANRSDAPKFLTNDEEIERGRLNPQSILYLPSLELNLDIFEVNGRCVADFEATVEVFLENTKIVQTDVLVWWPRYAVWKKNGFIQCAPSDFGRCVNDAVDDTLKSFIEDWTASQKQ